MKKAIFVNQETGPLLIDMINYCVENDVDATLYTGKIIKTYESLNNKVKVRNLITYSKKNNIVRVLSWIGFYFQALIFLLVDVRKDTYLWLSTNPPFLVWLAIFFKKKVFAHVYDVYPQALLALPWIKKESAIYKIFLALNKISFSKCIQIFTPSEGMKKMLLDATQEDRIYVIPWWANTEFIKPIPKEKNPFIQEHELDDKFIVMYSGNFGMTHNIEKILKASTALKDYKDIFFVIIGGGPKENIVNKFVDNSAATNLLVLPFQSEEILPFSLASADIAIVLDSFSANPNAGSTASIPSKTYYLMAAGNAIYAESDNTSELNRLINKYELGICDDFQGIDNLIEFILYCRNDENKLQSFKENSRLASFNFTNKNASLLYMQMFGDS